MSVVYGSFSHFGARTTEDGEHTLTHLVAPLRMRHRQPEPQWGAVLRYVQTLSFITNQGGTPLCVNTPKPVLTLNRKTRMSLCWRSRNRKRAPVPGLP